MSRLRWCTKMKMLMKNVDMVEALLPCLRRMVCIVGCDFADYLKSVHLLFLKILYSNNSGTNHEAEENSRQTEAKNSLSASEGKVRLINVIPSCTSYSVHNSCLIL